MITQLTAKRLTPELMLEDLPAFLTKVQTLIDLLQIDLSAQMHDHIALRINDPKLAKLAHKYWLNVAKEISNTMINSRPIIILELAKPLKFKQWNINFVEFPYPLANKQYPHEGWEHIEFVIASTESNISDVKKYFMQLQERMPAFAKQCKKLAKLKIKVKLSNPKGEKDRLANPTIAFKYQDICIKLHPYAIKEIIQSEL